MLSKDAPAPSPSEDKTDDTPNYTTFQLGLSRFAKGVLFFVCLYSIFFYGLYLGKWQNVYIQSTTPTGYYMVPENENDPNSKLIKVPTNQTNQPPPSALDTLRERASFMGQFWIGVAAWPAIYQYMNYNQGEEGLFGTFQRQQSEYEQEKMLRDSDKAPDLGWTYTVIAGVLNILVIYDAVAGAAFGIGTRKKPKKTKESAEEKTTDTKEPAKESQ